MKVDPTGNREVVAAIKLDSQSLKIAQTAAALATQAARPLRLVHVFEPTKVPFSARDRDLLDGYHGLATGIYDERSFFLQSPDVGTPIDVSISTLFEQAESELAGLASQFLETGIAVKTSVLVGRYPEAMLQLAAAHQGVLLVAGAEKRDRGLFQSHLKNTFRLMSGSQMPVLIIPDSRQAFTVGPDRPVRILIADDLSSSSWFAIRNLTSMIQNFHLPTDILHIHVEPVNTATMALSPDYELEVWPGIFVKDRLINDRHDFIKMRMKNRSRVLRRAATEANGKYHLELWHGKVASELKRAVEVHNADISVFGKHHLFHSHPPSIGQMGYKQMIGLDCAILVSPEEGKGLHV